MEKGQFAVTHEVAGSSPVVAASNSQAIYQLQRKAAERCSTLLVYVFQKCR